MNARHQSVALADIRQAAQRIAGRVRRTPLIAAAPTLHHGNAAEHLTLKLESLQVTGSFKPRGAVNKIASLVPSSLQPGVITASGGNHGLGVAYAAHRSGIPATIFVPHGLSNAKLAKLRDWGARVVVHGTVWDDANHAALQLAAAEGLAYIHPFADPLVVAGQGTVGLELMEAAPETDTLLVAIGGGGLISGVALAARALNSKIRIIGIEPIGAPTLQNSLSAGRPMVLDRVETAAGTLAPRSTDAFNFGIIQSHVADVLLVSDDEMRDAARWLWFEHGVAAELSGAAALAALLTRRYRPAPGERLCAIVCGAGTDGMT